MARHTIEVPDWVWEYFQQRYESVKPASYIRDVLHEWIAEDKAANVRRRTVDAAMGVAEYDAGTVITAQRNDICSFAGCGKAVLEGDEIVLQTRNGRKVVSHFFHYKPA